MPPISFYLNGVAIPKFIEENLKDKPLYILVLCGVIAFQGFWFWKENEKKDRDIMQMYVDKEKVHEDMRFDPPADILRRIKVLEKEILSDIADLEGLL